MISSKTLNIDNPKLDCRLKGFEKFSPKRIILDRNLEIKMNSYINISALWTSFVNFWVKKGGIFVIKNEVKTIN